MLVTEIEEAQALVIEVFQDDKKATFESQAVGVLDDALLIECITYDSQLVNLKKKNISVSMTVSLSPLPVRFNDVKVEAVKYKGRVYHLVRAAREGQEVNRRGAFRVYVGEAGEIKINASGPEKSVMVKDISITGFSVVSDQDLDADDANVRISYKDGDKRVVLQGRVVRVEELPNEKLLYGCELLYTPSSLGKYLNQKQTDKMGTSKKKDDKKNEPEYPDQLLDDLRSLGQQ